MSVKGNCIRQGLAWRARRTLSPAPVGGNNMRYNFPPGLRYLFPFSSLTLQQLYLSLIYLSELHGVRLLLRFTITTMLRSSLHKSGSCLSRCICPLTRSTYSASTLRASSVTSVRPSRLPNFSQRLQSRHYAVAAEETNKGVVSSLASGNKIGIEEAEKNV